MRRQLDKGDTRIIGEEIVQVRRLDDILEEHWPSDRAIDLLNIDVEGKELQVLQSNNWDKYKPDVILVEDYSVKTAGLGQSGIHQFLTDKGYRFVSHCFDTSIYQSDSMEERS